MKHHKQLSYLGTVLALTVASTALAGDYKSQHSGAFQCWTNCSNFSLIPQGVANGSTTVTVATWLPILRDEDAPMSFWVHWKTGRQSGSFCQVMYYLPGGTFGGSFATQPNGGATDELVRNVARGGQVSIPFDAGAGLYCLMDKKGAFTQGISRAKWVEGTE